MKLLKSMFMFLALASFSTAYAGGDHMDGHKMDMDKKHSMVNINTASAKTIAKKLKGVGKKKAAAIVAYRDANGPFKSKKDLLNVKGIGKKILKKNKGRIMLGMNPCSMKMNPCSMKHNPCSMKMNPCSMKHNPCAMKMNPCSMSDD